MNSCFACIVIAALLFSVRSQAESYAGWGKANKLAYRAKLCEVLEQEVQERAARLGKETGLPYAVTFQYPAGNEREMEKFSAAWTAKKFKEEDVDGRWKDLVRISAELSAKEAEARPKWQEKMKDVVASQRTEKEGAIQGTRIKARKLGAILDNSPSMTKFLPALRKEIKHTFEDYPSIEVWGSFINRFVLSTLDMYQVKGEAGSRFRPGKSYDELPENTWFDTRWYHTSPGDADDPFDPAWHFPTDFPAVPAEQMHVYSVLAERDNVSAIRGMVELHKVDTLYWFCDLKDKVDPNALDRIKEVIEKHKVKLYIHTVGRKPPPLLEYLAQSSGGKVITSKPRIIPPDKAGKK